MRRQTRWTEEMLEAEDEDEPVAKRLSQEQQQSEDQSKQEQTAGLIGALEDQLDETNLALRKIKDLLSRNASVSLDYFRSVIAGAPDAAKPQIEILAKVLNSMHSTALHARA